MSTDSRVLPRALTVAEAADYLRVHRVTIYRFAKTGKIKIRKIGGRALVLRDDLDRLLDSAPVVHGEAA